MEINLRKSERGGGSSKGACLTECQTDLDPNSLTS